MLNPEPEEEVYIERRPEPPSRWDRWHFKSKAHREKVFRKVYTEQRKDDPIMAELERARYERVQLLDKLWIRTAYVYPALQTAFFVVPSLAYGLYAYDKRKKKEQAEG